MEQALFYAKLEVLQQLLLDNIEDVLLSLKINLTKGSKMYYGPCPLHGGDNPMGLNIYNENAKVPGYWRCNTHHCEKNFKHKNLITFIQGILNTNFWGAIKWSCNLLKIKFDDIKGDLVKKEKVDFIRNYLNSKSILDKKKVLGLLVSRFVVDLKYLPNILFKEGFPLKYSLNMM